MNPLIEWNMPTSVFSVSEISEESLKTPMFLAQSLTYHFANDLNAPDEIHQVDECSACLLIPISGSCEIEIGPGWTIELNAAGRGLRLCGPISWRISRLSENSVLGVLSSGV